MEDRRMRVIKQNIPGDKSEPPLKAPPPAGPGFPVYVPPEHIAAAGETFEGNPSSMPTTATQEASARKIGELTAISLHIGSPSAGFERVALLPASVRRVDERKDADDPSHAMVTPVIVRDAETHVHYAFFASVGLMPERGFSRSPTFEPVDAARNIVLTPVFATNETVAAWRVL